MELDRRGAELPFQVLTEREERLAVAIASNEPAGWTKTFTGPRLCAAIVDRLTFAGQIIETGSTSYLLAHTRKQRPAAGYPQAAGTPLATAAPGRTWFQRLIDQSAGHAPYSEGDSAR